jgi:hypothetical protein
MSSKTTIVIPGRGPGDHVCRDEKSSIVGGKSHRCWGVRRACATLSQAIVIRLCCFLKRPNLSSGFFGVC